ncbi:MAG TPA: site-specific integrase, partial [Solirubrobacteraceae bacterium]
TVSSFSENKKDDDRQTPRRYAGPYAAISPICEDFLPEVGITKTSAYSCLCRRRHNHECRHTYASFLMAAGYTLRELMEYMGHSSLQATERYVKLLPQPAGPDGAADRLNAYLDRAGKP